MTSPDRSHHGSLDLAAVGNCMVAALIDRRAHIVWCCFPRFDGDPIFNALLDGGSKVDDGGGSFAVALVGQVACHQRYLDNTAVLRSVLEDKDGNALEIIDFAPRFVHFGRTFRPPLLIRRVRPLHGRPHVVVKVQPTFECGARKPEITRGSNHIRYAGPSQTVRLTTDAPVSYILEQRQFVVDRPMSFFLGTDEPLRSNAESTAREFLESTVDHWRDWVRALSIPFEWQEAVTRAAITLKLCNFEETGAIVAALTTSVPEAPGTQRNWDYRFCWLRDAYFVINALNRLGQTGTMEAFSTFITNIAGDLGQLPGRLDMPPLFGITREAELEERFAPALTGYRGMGPVRIGNAAYTQVQNDAYGAIVLASVHAFFDRRLIRTSDGDLYSDLERLAARAVAVFDVPDAGPWELRTKSSVHTFSSVMCWAAADRLAVIAGGIGRPERAQIWRAEADRMHATIAARAFSNERNSFVSTFDGNDLDATLLLLADLGFVAADDPRFVSTVEAVGAALKRGRLFLRYDTADDFGHMQTGFLICGFWYVDALWAIGRREEARELFEQMLGYRNSFGLLSEDADLVTGELWGNFPQTYSMVGLINSAVRLSRSWEDAF
jgi:GH15 family glucan-1,4-alpha-glucosidase